VDQSELEALLADIESDRVERKEALSSPDRVREAICAFANDLPDSRRPGVVFIGARDDGSCAGPQVTDDLLRNLASLRDDGNILPLPSLIVQKRTVAGCELAVVIVQPSDAPPVRCRGRAWVRVGPRRAVATPEEERRLAEKRRTRDLPFDLQPVRAASLGDLDLDWFVREYLPSCVPSDVLDANERSAHQQLTSLRFADLPPDPVPTVLGVLMAGMEPTQFVPGAYVQFLRLDGPELSSPIKHQREIGGRIVDQLRRLDELLEANISVATSIVGAPVEVQRPDYPLDALQQLVRNAVMHRAYDGTNAPVRVTWFADRIEIQNPGGPFGQVTRENFGQPGVTDYRNPHLAEAMRNLGYVQRFGVGIPLARKALADNGNPAPEFTCEASYTLVTVRSCR
jgi:ATP-dependent DNA helicase RecG